MEKIVIEYPILERSRLNKDDELLVKEAELTLEKAHAPYSGFRVGCAIKLAFGDVYVGNNQENAAYPSGLCAERVALFAAKSNTKEAVDTIVIVARGQNGEQANAFSCGSCRQVMMEYAYQQEKPIRILMQTAEGRYVEIKDVKELLPFHFNSDSLQ